MEEVKSGIVYLVGAGPGDPELITLRGAKVLASADVVVYDALVQERLLDMAPKDAELVYMGKRCGRTCPSHPLHAVPIALHVQVPSWHAPTLRVSIGPV